MDNESSTTGLAERCAVGDKQQLNQIIEQTKDKRTLSGNTYGKTYFKENFIPLLQLGNYHENLSVNRIIAHSKYDKPKITFNNDNRYDIKINKKTFEVKTDIKAVKSGNVFIENMCKTKLSGISSTEAKYYLIVIPYEPEEMVLLIKVRKLKELIEKQTYFKHFTPNKYNNFSGGYVFTLETLKAIAKLI